MRIALCTTLYPPLGIGGAERSAQFLAEALVVLGHDVTVLSQGTSIRRTEECRNGVRIIRTASPPGFGPNIYAHRSTSTKVLSRILAPLRPHRGRMYAAEVAKLRPDIVHTNSVGGLEDIWLEAARANIPAVHTLRNHGSLCPGRMFAEGRPCEGQCDPCARRTTPRRQAGETLRGIAGISNYILQEHLSCGYFSTVRNRCVIPNSYSHENLDWTPRSSTEPVRLGYLGRLHETKGVNQLVEAMASLEGAVTLSVAGTGNPGFVTHLKSKAPANVKFLGFVAADTVLNTVDALVVPSLWREPFGRVYAEALVHGVPVIGSIHGAGRELVVEGQTGWICDPGTPGALVETIKRATNTLNRPNSLRTNCLAASARFSPEVVARAYEDFYERAINTAPPPHILPHAGSTNYCESRR